MQPNDYLKQPYTRILIPNEDNSYSAEMLEFPGCFAQGDTPDEAYKALENAALSWIEVALDRGLMIPEPFMNQGYNGKIALRLPKSLHRQSVELAEREGVSLNQFLVSAISARVGAEDLLTRLMDRFEHKISTIGQNIVFMPEPRSTQKTNCIPQAWQFIQPQNIKTMATGTTEIKKNG